MAFSIVLAFNRSIFCGCEASRKSRNEAGRVTSSFVRKLKTHEIKTRKGFFHFLPTSVTEGVLRFLTSLRNTLTMTDISSFESISDGPDLKAGRKYRYRRQPPCPYNTALYFLKNLFWHN